MCENLNSIDLELINSMCMEIGQVFTNASVKSFPTAYSSVSGNKTKSKRWFGYQCENARRKYHKDHKNNRKQPSDTNRTNLKTASKTYKNTMNFYRRDRASPNYSISIWLVWRKMLTSFMYRLIWAGSSEFATYHLCEQRRFGQSCASPESQLLAQTSNESRVTFRQKARSLAPLNDWTWAVKIFHDQEYSKTQIRLTRPIFLC